MVKLLLLLECATFLLKEFLSGGEPLMFVDYLPQCLLISSNKYLHFLLERHLLLQSGPCLTFVFI